MRCAPTRNIERSFTDTKAYLGRHSYQLTWTVQQHQRYVLSDTAIGALSRLLGLTLPTVGCERFSERAKLLTHPRSMKSAEPIKKVHLGSPTTCASISLCEWKPLYKWSQAGLDRLVKVTLMPI